MSLYLTATFVLLALSVYYALTRRRHNRLEAPGPPGHILIGNLFDFPRQYQWKTFAEWADKYGENSIPTAQLGLSLML
jgi:hypothetical protein